MFNISKDLVEIIRKEDWARGVQAGEDFWVKMMEWLDEHLLPEFLIRLSKQIDAIIHIDPDLSEREILKIVAMQMVESLNARYASVRIYDPDTDQMLSFGSHPEDEETRKIHISLEGSIAGEVVKSGETCLVPNISEEDRYKDKGIIERKGINSMMAIPFEIPRFFPHERNTAGVIQIYYQENNRQFSPLEIEMAEIMSRRLSFVMARKKILAMHRANEKKEAIVRQIFLKLGSWEGVKMKDIFNRLIPELADMINLQSCALFSVADDYERVVLEAGYPDSTSHHGIGKSFSTRSEPAFELILGLRKHLEDSPYEVVTPSYVLVVDPLKSNIVSNNIRQFAANRNINSILYVPLSVGEEITHTL